MYTSTPIGLLNYVSDVHVVALKTRVVLRFITMERLENLQGKSASSVLRSLGKVLLETSIDPWMKAMKRALMNLRVVREEV